MKVPAWFRPIFFGLVLATAFAVTARDVGAKDGLNIDRSAALAGRSSFAAYCKVCHGPPAEGDGPLAEALKTKPADLTQFLVRHEGEYPFEEIVAKIDGRKGGTVRKRSPCPVWGNTSGPFRNFRASSRGVVRGRPLLDTTNLEVPICGPADREVCATTNDSLFPVRY